MAEERKLRSQQIIERLRNEYGKMADERRENDRLVEETREEADRLERKVRKNTFSTLPRCLLRNTIDERKPKKTERRT